MTPDDMKALIADARLWDSEAARSAPTTTATLIERLADALEAAYDAGRRELAARFATQDATRRAAIEELIAWEDEIEAHVTSEDFRGATCAACGAHFSASGQEAGITPVPTDGSET